MCTPTKFMSQAFDESLLGSGYVSPNPMVGCVIVKNNKIISRGHHKKFGGEHAEIVALKKAGKEAKGADIYINMEPCDHMGKTAPCTKALIEYGIARVFIAMKDPNPLVNGRGVKRLSECGIEVNIGILKEEAQKLNEVFIHHIKYKKPWVVAKIAQSLDGKVATKSGESKWITHVKSREFSQTLRLHADAIIVGVQTVIKDNPMLTCRTYNKADPTRIILDTNARTPISSHIITQIKNSNAKTIFITGKNIVDKALYRLKNDRVEIWQTPIKNGKIDLELLLNLLYKKGMMSILVEGGPCVIGSFRDLNLINKIHIFISPALIGGKKAYTSVASEGSNFLSESTFIKNMTVEKIATDIHITGYCEK